MSASQFFAKGRHAVVKTHTPFKRGQIPNACGERDKRKRGKGLRHPRGDAGESREGQPGIHVGDVRGNRNFWETISSTRSVENEPSAELGRTIIRSVEQAPADRIPK